MYLVLKETVCTYFLSWFSQSFFRSFIGKRGTESGAEITEGRRNLLFKLNGQLFVEKQGLSF